MRCFDELQNKLTAYWHALSEGDFTDFDIEDLEASGYNKFCVLDEYKVGMYDGTTWGIINGEWMDVQCMFNGTIGYVCYKNI